MNEPPPGAGPQADLPEAPIPPFDQIPPQGGQRPTWHGVALALGVLGVHALCFIGSTPAALLGLFPGFTQWLLIGPIGFSWKTQGDVRAARALWITALVILLLNALCTGYVIWVFHAMGPSY